VLSKLPKRMEKDKHEDSNVEL